MYWDGQDLLKTMAGSLGKKWILIYSVSGAGCEMKEGRH